MSWPGIGILYAVAVVTVWALVAGGNMKQDREMPRCRGSKSDAGACLPSRGAKQKTAHYAQSHGVRQDGQEVRVWKL